MCTSLKNQNSWLFLTYKNFLWNFKDCEELSKSPAPNGECANITGCQTIGEIDYKVLICVSRPNRKRSLTVEKFILKINKHTCNIFEWKTHVSEKGMIIPPVPLLFSDTPGG